jgi:hypothetical protein
MLEKMITLTKYFILLVALVTVSKMAYSQSEKNQQMVRLAKLVIDASELDSYKAALKEEIEASVRLEPGC